MSPAEAGKSLLFSASLKSAASLMAVLDLVDRDYSQDIGVFTQHRPGQSPSLQQQLRQMDLCSIAAN